MDHLSQHIESLIFCSTTPVSVQEIQECLTSMFGSKVQEKLIDESLQSLINKYEKDEYAFRIEHLADGYAFLTKPAYQSAISILLKQKSTRKLSNSAMETLSIIAYKQPVTKAQIEQIRGVNSDYSVQKLLEKELIEIKGKAETIGRPTLYGTSQQFMDYFGINKLEDLPDLKDLQQEENTIGKINE